MQEIQSNFICIQVCARDPVIFHLYPSMCKRSSHILPLSKHVQEIQSYFTFIQECARGPVIFHLYPSMCKRSSHISPLSKHVQEIQSYFTFITSTINITRTKQTHPI